MNNRTYAIFGLGRYGQAVAKELVRNGAEVLAIDKNEDVINDCLTDIPYCKCADITDPDVIKQLGISNIDVVIITMANNLEASIMATVLCKEIGVKNVIAKCSTEIQKRILKKIGANKVVLPESDSGTRLAKSLLNAGFIDMIEISNDVSIVELEVKKEWIDKNLIELDLRKKYSINVIAIIDSNDNINTNINPLLPLDKSMKLLVIADTLKLNNLN